MQAHLKTTPAFKAFFRGFCEEEATRGYYTHNPQMVKPLEKDFLPEWVQTGADIQSNECLIPAGAVIFNEGMVYTSCAGNWLTLSEDGYVRAGGRRHGIPFIKKADVTFWRYPQGGTLTPELHPLEHPTEDQQMRLRALARKKEVERVTALLPDDIRDIVQKTAVLKGYRLERAKAFLRVMLKKSDYATLFPS